jgi:hypothetical protein
MNDGAPAQIQEEEDEDFAEPGVVCLHEVGRPRNVVA